MKLYWQILRWVGAGIVTLGLFVSENELGEVATTICVNYTLVTGAIECPAVLNSPEWGFVFSCIAYALLIALTWPLIGRVLVLPIRAYIAIGSWVRNLWASIRRGVRTVAVTAIEETTGKQVFVSANAARQIVRHSEFGRNAYKQGMPGGSSLARLARIEAVLGKTTDDEAAALDQFHAWIDLALSSFRKEVKFLKYGEDLSKFYRQDDSGSYEYAETELREWLKGKWVEKVTERFGGV